MCFSWLGLQAAQEPADTPPPSELSDSQPPTATVSKTPSEMAGLVVLVGIILVFLIPATDVLQFQPLTTVMTELLRILGQVLVGVLVFAVGLYLANLVFNILSSSGGGQAKFVAQAAPGGYYCFSGSHGSTANGDCDEYCQLSLRSFIWRRGGIPCRCLWLWQQGYCGENKSVSG